VASNIDFGGVHGGFVHGGVYEGVQGVLRGV